MTDFLSTLLAKTSEAAQVIRPRPISLFEPWSGATRPMLHDDFLFETIAQKPAPDNRSAAASPPRQSSAAPPQKPAPPLKEFGPAPTRRPPEPLEQSPRPQQPHEPAPRKLNRVSTLLLEPKFVTPQSPESNREEKVEQPHSDSGPTPTPSPFKGRRRQARGEANQPDRSAESRPPAGDTQVKSVVDHHHIKAEDPAGPTLEPASLPPVVEQIIAPEKQQSTQTGPGADRPPARGPAGEQNRLVVERINSRVVSERLVLPAAAAPLPDNDEKRSSSSPPASVVVQPDVSRYLEPPLPGGAEAQSTPPPDSTPERTINVTIGRIEVRAKPPSPAPKKQRSRSPVMSLDAYLRERRNGGGG